MASWKKVIVSGSQAHLAAVTASIAVLVGSNQYIGTTQATTYLSGSFTGSFTGNGSGLTGITATSATSATSASVTQIFDQSTSANTFYPTIVSATSGYQSQSVDVNLTYTPSTDTLNLGNIIVNSGSITTNIASSTANVFNTNATTLNIGGAGTTISIGAATGVTAIKNDLTVTGSTILGDASGDAVTINAATVKIANVGAGSTDTVVIKDASNNLATRAIDTRVWGTTLIDASGTPTANQVPYFTDANTVAGTAGFTYTPGTTLFTAPNVLVTGDITVQGTASFQQTTNLQVADRFVLLASGSNSTSDGGIVVQQATLGVGELFGWDAGTSRWAVTSSFTANVSSYTPDAFVSLATTAAATDPNTTSPPARYNVAGNIYVSSTANDESIWIYS